jgi:monoamine oxidase
LIAKAIGREVTHLIRHNAKVAEIRQDDSVTAAYIDPWQPGAETKTARADWCLCTISLSILCEIGMNVGA